MIALSDLSLEMFDDQVTALLGQNGAGKTTAIGVLTGLHPPSSGDATVFGRSVRTHMTQIRQMTGVCPQHDLIYLGLTCEQHLELLGAIKGISENALRREAGDWIEKVGLSSKLRERAGTMSGGQKRKLSVAMAMIGSPRFVVLDEPTAGMDPESRRAIWEVIGKARENRSILLTTHFMDEADALADRIAIIAKRPGEPDSGGTLRVVGTSLSLKSEWGAGYHLTLSLAPQSRTDEIVSLVQQYIRGASVEETSPSEMSLLLPTNESGSYASLFAGLVEGDRMATLGIRAYGVSLPSLQEIFLRVIQDDVIVAKRESRREASIRQSGQEVGVPGGANDGAGREEKSGADEKQTARLVPSVLEPRVTPSLRPCSPSLCQSHLQVPVSAHRAFPAPYYTLPRPFPLPRMRSLRVSPSTWITTTSHAMHSLSPRLLSP